LKPEEIQKIAEIEHDMRMAYKYRINVCCSSGCIPFGAQKLLKAFEEAVKELGVQNVCKVARTGCVGTCSLAPVVLIDPGNHLYQNVRPEDAKKLFKSMLLMDGF
jgi:NADH:ubiquinone oxidoreductase 24 kD subunit